MKHADKAKATASTKTSPEKSSRKISQSSRKASESGREKATTESGRGQAIRRATTKTHSGGDSRSEGEPEFARPVIAQAYSDASKTYHNALKRLTD